MKTQRTSKLIKKLEVKQKRIDEITRELHQLQLESGNLVKKLKEEQETAELEEAANKPASRFTTFRPGRFRTKGNAERFTPRSNVASYPLDSIEIGDTVEICNDYKNKKYGELKGRQGKRK